MKTELLKKQNISKVLWAYIFAGLSVSLVEFFLPFFLKQEGLTIIQIGALFTFGIAFGSLFIGRGYSNILKRIKIKTGFLLTRIFHSIKYFLLALFPTTLGVLSSKFAGQIGSNLSRTSNDVAIQHNLYKNSQRKIGTLSLFTENFGMILGIIIAILLIKFIGFKYSFFAFAFFALIPLIFHLRIKDDTRFKLEKKRKVKLSGLSKKLKLFIFSEMLYWFALSASFSLVVTFLVQDKFGGSLEWIGYIFISLYLTMNIFTILTKNYLDKKNWIKSSILGMIILLISALVVVFSQNLWVVLLAFALEGIGAGIWYPSKLALYWKFVPKNRIEDVSGITSGFRGFVSALGPLAGGFLVTFFGVTSPFYLKAILSLVVILIYVYILLSKKQ